MHMSQCVTEIFTSEIKNLYISTDKLSLNPEFEIGYGMSNTTFPSSTILTIIKSVDNQNISTEQQNVTSPMTTLCKPESTTKSDIPESSHDAFLYIVVVLSFYAFSMVILMVKYIRRERQEAEMAHYYAEFVSRDRFKAPVFEIKRCMNKIMNSSTKLEHMSEESEEFMSCLDLSDETKHGEKYVHRTTYS